MTLVEPIRNLDYSLGGWRFRSAIPLDALPVWDGDPTQAVDIELVRGPVDEVACDDPIGVIVSSKDFATVVSVDAGRFGVSGGRKVVADVRSGALAGVVETMIVGPVLGTLCYQRGILPLHSNTIVIDGKAVALSGRSGAGKSTLAAILMKRGHRLISDDVLPLAIDNGRTFALPSSQNLRLWGETLDLLGHDKQGLRRAADGCREKYYLPTSHKTTTRWPLTALVWLDRDPVESNLLVPKAGVLRAWIIYKAAYRQHLTREFAALGSREVTNISLPGVSVYGFWRPRDLSLIEEQADMIERLVTTGADPEAAALPELEAAHR